MNILDKDKVFTTGNTGHDEFTYIEEKVGVKDFSKLIEIAKQSTPPKELETGSITGGFAHNQLSKLSDTIANNINDGSIKQFFVMAGCDGRSSKRSYYTNFAKGLPDDTVILTSGCAKFKYNKLHLGDINDIPCVLDAGQCNDSYSLVVTALNLAEIYECDFMNYRFHIT